MICSVVTIYIQGQIWDSVADQTHLLGFLMTIKYS